VDYGSHDVGAAFVVADAVHEAAVYFQGVELPALAGRQR
jgi:hypothetical protein